MTTSDLAQIRESPATPPQPPISAPLTPRAGWRPPLMWRVLLTLARLVVPVFCRLRITGGIPAELHGRPFILAGNHIGNFDPIALTAACARLGVAPRIMATGGLFRAPLVGPVLRHCGHLQVDRGRANVTVALDVAAAAVTEGAVVAGYPEGRISLEPGLWPERGRTGIARLALTTATSVIPVSQWGAHELMPWNGFGGMIWRLLGAVRRRPVVHLAFGDPVDLSDLRAGAPRHAQRATDRIMAAIVEGLRPLRAAEPVLPRYVDLTRPVTAARGYATRGYAARDLSRRGSAADRPERLPG